MAKPQINQSADELRTISREEIAARLQDRALVILNVLPKETHADAHIAGSINLPVAEIESKARQLIPNLSQEIVVYCAGST